MNKALYKWMVLILAVSCGEQPAPNKSLKSVSENEIILNNKKTISESTFSHYICDNDRVSLDSCHLFLTKSNLEKVGPIQFLKYLTNFESSEIIISQEQMPQKGWIKKEHVVELEKYLNNKIPCPLVRVPSIMSFVPNGDSVCIPKSTVGVEAARLLKGYELGVYPPPFYY